MRWFAKYKCGCSTDAALRNTILDYCGRHGDARVELFEYPVEVAALSKTRKRGKQ